MSIEAPPPERRARNDLRAIFVEAFEMLAPFFSQQNGWGSTSSHDHLAYRALKERFPMLSAQDCLVLVMTAKRLLPQGRPLGKP
jgi:hypothetical protein